MKKPNLGLIGLGSQGRIHLRNAVSLNNARLIGVADVSERALRLAEKMGVTNVFTNYEDLLKDPRIDAVIISLPNFLHLEATVKAAEAGKHILLEKPLARNVKEGEEILSNVRKNGVRLMVGYDLRFNPMLKNLKQKIDDGYFGDVQTIEATNISHGPFTSRSDRVGPTPVASWWFDKEQVGGGALLDLGSHMINLLVWYFGEVQAVDSYLGYRFNMDLEDSGTCLMRFKDGPTAVVNVGWFSKDSVQSLQICGTSKNYLACISPAGRASIVWNDLKRKIGLSGIGFYYEELKHFVECLANDLPPSPSGDEGLTDLRIIAKAYENATKTC